MSFSWAAKLAPAEPAQPQGFGDHGSQYAAYQRDKPTNGASGSFIYSAEYQAAINGQRTISRPDLYEGSKPYQGLSSYKQQRSKYLPKPGESAWAFKGRLETAGLENLAAELAPDELDAVAKAYNAAVEHINGVTSQQIRSTSVSDWGETRSSFGLDSVTDRGIAGTPQERSAAVHAAQPRVTSAEHIGSWDSRPAQPMSRVDAMQAMRDREAAQRAAGQQ